MLLLRLLPCWLCAWLLFAAPAHAVPRIDFSHSALGAEEVALVVNERDPYSREVGDYYAARRGIPPANVIRVSFDPEPAMSREAFEALWARIEARVPATVQAFALAWTRPWRVDCMSVTSAFAFGYDRALCSPKPCAPTRVNPLFDADVARPYDRYGVRPAMLIAGRSAADAKAMIDRGLAVEGRHPAGTAYLLSTPDAARNVRAALFPAALEALAARLPVKVVEGIGIGERRDALFYFTGLAQVPEAGRLRLVGGALADHLTSYGGVLEGGGQMSALTWLAAGASASYGTVVEPCSHPQKFPLPAIVMDRYLAGSTALQAYWSGVAWAGEGVFVGDPLARPFAPVAVPAGDSAMRITMHSPGPAVLTIHGADSPIGPFRVAGRGPSLRPGRNQFVLRGLRQAYYRIGSVKTVERGPRRP